MPELDLDNFNNSEQFFEKVLKKQTVDNISKMTFLHDFFKKSADVNKSMKNYLVCKELDVSPGADPGFLNRGFKFSKGGLICYFYLFI